MGSLRGQGFAINGVTLYAAQPVAMLSGASVGALCAGSIDFALFFSPRTAAIFTRLASAAAVAKCCAKITALSISAAADAALAGLPWLDRRTAETPNQPALLDLLDNLLAERRPAQR